MMTDPIADMLTRIRNAGTAQHAQVACPSSRLKLAVARVLDALPAGVLVSWPLKLPLLSWAFGLLYDAFAVRRHRVSAILGMNVCSVPPRSAQPPSGDPTTPA